MSRLAAALLLSLVMALAAQAADDQCASGTFGDDQQTFGIAQAVGKTPIPMLAVVNCGAREGWCRDLLKPNTRVITGRTQNGLVCVLEPSRDNGGWVPASRLAGRPVAERPPLADWRGWWRYGDNLILLDPRPGGALLVSGRAYWPMRHPPEEQFPGGAHFGQMGGGEEQPKGNRVEVDDGGCHVRLTLVGRYLVVGDNRGCGGMNVTFSGVYARRAPRRQPSR